MSPRKKPLLALGFVLLALVVLSFFAPPVLERGIATWLRYEARRSGLVLTFSEIHAPLFRPVTITDLKIIGAVEMRAPFLEKCFPHVRGVTRWQDDRLSIGSLNLLEGFAIDSLVIDLTALRTGRVGTDLGVSLLGGKMRANIATESPGKTRIWEAAGTASGISLPQLANALGLTVPVQGMVHGSKFKFRGDSLDFLNDIATIWPD